MDASPDSIRAVGESDLLAIARVARSTWNNWIKQGAVAASLGVYSERDVIEACIVSALIDALGLREVTVLWPAAAPLVLPAISARSLRELGDVRLVVDLYTWEVRVAVGRRALVEALHGSAHARSHLVVEAGRIVADAKAAFWKRATSANELARDGRRKSSGDGRASAAKP